MPWLTSIPLPKPEPGEVAVRITTRPAPERPSSRRSRPENPGLPTPRSGSRCRAAGLRPANRPRSRRNRDARNAMHPEGRAAPETGIRRGRSPAHHPHRRRDDCRPAGPAPVTDRTGRTKPPAAPPGIAAGGPTSSPVREHSGRTVSRGSPVAGSRRSAGRARTAEPRGNRFRVTEFVTRTSESDAVTSCTARRPVGLPFGRPARALPPAPRGRRTTPEGRPGGSTPPQTHSTIRRSGPGPEPPGCRKRGSSSPSPGRTD